MKILNKLFKTTIFKLLAASKKERRKEYRAQLRKMNYLDDEIEEILDEVFKLLPSKKEKMAMFWIRKGEFNIFGQDDLRDLNAAYDLLEDLGKDYMDYVSPREALANNSKYLSRKESKSNFNLNTIPEFSNKQVHGAYSIYHVADSFEGMMAVRKAIDVILNEEANPWCLIARRYDGSMNEAFDCWKHYSSYPKRIAFKAGKPFAFCANAFMELNWSDMNNLSHNCFPDTSVFDKEGYELANDYKAMAFDPNCDEKTFFELAGKEDVKVKRFLAKLVFTPDADLKMLASDTDNQTRKNALKTLVEKR